MNRYESATALLATSRHLMTGREILICEYYAGESDDSPSIPTDATESNATVFKHLELQFTSEITAWHAAQDRTASRRAVETHNRLHPAA